MPDAHTCQAHAAAILAHLQCEYDRLHAVLDDRLFHQAASHMLDTIHAALCAKDLPPDLAAAYQQLERRTRALHYLRMGMPNRPLF